MTINTKGSFSLTSLLAMALVLSACAGPADKAVEPDDQHAASGREPDRTRHAGQRARRGRHVAYSLLAGTHHPQPASLYRPERLERLACDLRAAGQLR